MKKEVKKITEKYVAEMEKRFKKSDKRGKTFDRKMKQIFSKKAK